MVAFNDKVTGTVDKDRSVVVVFLGFGKAFDPVFYSLVIIRLVKQRLDK